MVFLRVKVIEALRSLEPYDAIMPDDSYQSIDSLELLMTRLCTKLWFRNRADWTSVGSREYILKGYSFKGKSICLNSNNYMGELEQRVASMIIEFDRQLTQW